MEKCKQPTHENELAVIFITDTLAVANMGNRAFALLMPFLELLAKYKKAVMG